MNVKNKKLKKFNNSNNSSITLDKKHTEYLEKFYIDDNSILPDLIAKKSNLKEFLKSAKTIDQILDTKDQIKEINNKIKLLKKEKKEYFLNNSQIIFEYFEEKKNISENTSTNTSSKNRLVNNFFNPDKVTPHENINFNNENSTILKKYLNNVDENHFDFYQFVRNTDVCRFCNKGELIPIEEDGQMVCNNCFRNTPYLIENDKPSYKEPPKEVCFYAYKRINHFKEIISQFQGKETTQIPEEVIINIKSQIKKERIEISEITNIKTKEILKKLGYNKYYEHVPFIKEKLGIKPPIMTPELEETLCNLFSELQAPYAKYCPNDRVNFLNYYYTAYKLCELLGETQYIDHFPMLKDREKRLEQDVIWKKICNDLNWEFISTVR